MARTKCYDVYKFSELSPKAQTKALDRLRGINVDDGHWFHFVYEDAARIGLKISGFDIYRRDIDLKLTVSATECASRIIIEHGKECDTYKSAMQFFRLKHSRERGEMVKERSKRLAFLLSRDYIQMLSDEYDYQTSDEAIKETIEANDYEFTTEGRLD